MSELCEIQKAFSGAVIGEKYETVIGALCPAEGSPLRTVALYRRLIRNNYIEVLKVTYPVLYRLVGKEYFGLLARGYIKMYPSTSGDLFSYGRFLPMFLEELGVPTLFAEMARLEWACHEIHHAPDSTPPAQNQVEAVTSVDPSRVIIQFHPASQLLFFLIPVHRVWLALQPDAPSDEVVDLPLPKEEAGILVTRPFQKVQVIPFVKTLYTLLEALFAGKDLASVARMAVSSGPEFDLSHFLADLLKQQIVIGFSIRDWS